MKRNLLLILSLAFSLSLAAAGPKLVLTITVEDMDAEYVKKFENEFTQGGFKRFINAGRADVEFDYNTTDFATDIATIFTGTDPCFHGIIGAKRYSPKEQKNIYSLLDKESQGLNDDLKLSGKQLLSTTAADALYEETYGAAKIVSIATDPTIAMIMAGHAGLPIYMNNLTGQWSTSSYYRASMPEWLVKYNESAPIEQYLDKNWENIQPAGYYVMAARKGSVGFNYQVRGVCNGYKFYDNFTTIPYVNDYVCDLALKAVESEKMGNDLVTDMLMVNFSLKKFYLKNSDNYTLELEDAYLRLDRTLMRLMENIENKVGKENIEVVLVSSRTSEVNVTSAVNQKIKYNSFNVDKYMALLNSYLMAHFGQKKWVMSCYSGNIYLNRDEIDKAGLDISEVSKKAMEFFYLIPGVQNLCTAYQMEQAFYSTGVLRYAYYRGLSGDLLYSLMPRWYEVDLKENPTGYFTSYTKNVTAWFYGGGSNTASQKIKATNLLSK